MKNNDETVKLMAETLKSGMIKFISSPASEETKAELKNHMVSVLRSFIDISDLPSHLPHIDITMRGTEATFSFRDPKTNEKIDLATWMSRSGEGFYD